MGFSTSFGGYHDDHGFSLFHTSKFEGRVFPNGGKNEEDGNNKIITIIILYTML